MSNVSQRREIELCTNLKWTQKGMAVVCLRDYTKTCYEVMMEIAYTSVMIAHLRTRFETATSQMQEAVTPTLQASKFGGQG